MAAKKIEQVSGFMSYNPKTQKEEPSSATVKYTDGTYAKYYRGQGRGIPKYVQAAMKKKSRIK